MCPEGSLIRRTLLYSTSVIVKDAVFSHDDQHTITIKFLHTLYTSNTYNVAQYSKCSHELTDLVKYYMYYCIYLYNVNSQDIGWCDRTYES